MSAPADKTARIDKLYDNLSRYQWWCRRLGLVRSGTGLEMHKRLRAATARGLPGSGCADLNVWLWHLVAPCTAPATKTRVLDIGCGFGATVLAWAEHGSVEAVGLTLSRYQQRKATREARRLGFADVCTFHRQSFDDPIESPSPSFDVIVSIETLFHAEDLGRTMRRLSEHVRPGGVIALVEDMAVDDSVEADPDARALLDRWSTAELKTVEDYRVTLAATGFALVRDIDLTGQVDLLRLGRDRRERYLSRIRRIIPLGRVVIDAFLGGIAMERLYAAGRLNYRAMLATRIGDEQ